MSKCKHKWINMEDGSLDKFCVRCRKFAMQAQISMNSQAPSSQPLGKQVAREKMEVPFFNGSEHVRINVYKDDLIKQINKEIGIGINLFSSASR